MVGAGEADRVNIEGSIADPGRPDNDPIAWFRGRPLEPGRLRLAGEPDAGPPAGSDIIAAMVTLSRADVEHVAHLARLGLSDEELTRLEGQLNHILEQYTKLAELDTDHIAPTAQTIELENILRDDVVRPSLPVEAVLANAAEIEGDFIVVPAIMGEP